MPAVDRLHPPQSSHERRAKSSGSTWAGRRCWSAFSTPTPRCSGRAARRSTGQTEDELVDLLVREIERGAPACPGVAAVGLGIPATIDHDRGVAVSAVNLPIENLPIRDLVSERTGLPVFVDNDANVAALAEHLYGAARGARNAVMLTIGTGIGGGLILGGEVYRGSTGAGAELGPHGDRDRRAALPGQLPRPRLRRDARLRDGARPRGAGGGRARARTRRWAGCSPRARRSTARRSPRRRSPATPTRGRGLRADRLPPRRRARPASPTSSSPRCS